MLISQQKGLEELIENGCDRIAVMNYYRGAEIKNIATEVDLVQKHGKGIMFSVRLPPGQEFPLDPAVIGNGVFYSFTQSLSIRVQAPGRVPS